MSSKTLAVSAGKGGAGSTFFAVNLAVSLSRLDKSVLLVDLGRFGGGVPSFFGQKFRCGKALNQILSKPSELGLLINATDLKRVSYMQSFSDEWTVSASNIATRALELMEYSKASGFDFVIFDIGSNDSAMASTIFNSCEHRILITTPEATSLEKSYKFLESVSLQNLIVGHGAEMAGLIKTCIDEYRATAKNGTVSMLDFIQQRLPTLDGVETLKDRKIHFVINQCRARSDYDLGPAIQSACRKYYGFKVSPLGNLDSDNAVQQASRNQEPVLVGQPFAFVSGQFLTISRTFLQIAAKGNFDSIRLKSVV